MSLSYSVLLFFSFLCFTVVFLHCLFPFCSSLMSPTFTPVSFLYALLMFSLFLFFIRLCIHKHSSFCLPVVYRALVSIKWASLLF